MVDFRSENRTVGTDKRKDPRIEFRCNATVFGIDGILTVTDISLGGVFIEVELKKKVTVGQNVTVSLKLPTEKSVMRLKAKIMSQVDRGIGCQFLYKNVKEKKSIYQCFDFYKDMLPIE